MFVQSLAITNNTRTYIGQKKFNSSEQHDLPKEAPADRFVGNQKIADLSDEVLQTTLEALAYGIQNEEPASRQQEINTYTQFQNVREEIEKRIIEKKYKST